MNKALKLGFGILFLIIFTSICFGSTLDENIKSYYRYDSDARDFVGGNNGTISGATSVTGIINNSYSFDGTNDYIETSSNVGISGSSDRSMFGWVKYSGTEHNAGLFGYGAYTSQSYFFLTQSVNGDGEWGLWGYASDCWISDEADAINDNSWHHIGVVVVDSGSKLKMYRDGENIENCTITPLSTTDTTLKTGFQNGGGVYSQAIIDEIGLWNKSLNDTEVLELYNNGTGKQYPFLDTLVNFTISARDSSTLNALQTFNATVNGTFYNTTTGLITLPYLTEDGNILNITVNAENYFSYTNETYNSSTSLVADLVPELLEDFTLLTPNNTKTNESYYNVTYTEAVSPTSKTVTYNISVYYTNGTLKNTFETTDLTYELNITDYNANIYNITVNAEENNTGTNYTHSSLLYVDKLNYIYFKDGVSSDPLVGGNVTISSNTIGEELYITDAEGKISYLSFRNLSLINETTTITYEDDVGYVTPITFTYNATTLPYNISYNISRANINVEINDATTGNYITEFVTIAITGLGTFNTTNGTLFLENHTISSGEYTFYISSQNYTSNQKTITFTNQEQLDVTLTMINKTNENLGTVFVNIYDSFLDIVSGADVRLQELNPATSSFEEVSQRISSSSGTASFQIILNDKVYRVYVTYAKDGITYEGYSLEEGEIIFTDGQEINVYLDTIVDTDEGSLYNLDIDISNTDLVNNVSFHTVDFIDRTGNSHEVCLGYFYLNGIIETELLEICSDSSSGTLNQIWGYALNRSLTNIVKVYVKEGDYIKYYYEQKYTSTDSFENNFEIIIGFLIMSLLLAGLGMALHLNRIDYFIYVTIFLSALWLTLTPSFYSAGQFGLTIILCLSVLYVAKQRSNLENV